MATDSTEPHGRWWRFSEYEIWEPPWAGAYSPNAREHFRYLRPALGATLEPYEISVSSGPGEPSGGVQASLLTLDLEREDSIVEWCQQFGLLGILTEESQLIRVAPRWEHLFGDPGAPFLAPTQLRYVRTHVGWSGRLRSTLKGENDSLIKLDHEDRLEDRLHTLVDKEDTSLPPAAALLASLFSEGLEERPLSEAIGQFFPGVPREEVDTYEYPMPLTIDFWRQYAEPLGRFRQAVHRFRGILANLAQSAPLEDIPVDARRALVRGRAELHAILSVSPGLGLELDGTFSPKWAFSSLLAIAAFEVWQKLIGGQAIKHCMRPNCRKLFLTGNSAKGYCSDRCRQAEEKARQRRR